MRASGAALPLGMAKYVAQFSSQVRNVPHGVYPVPQLFSVPRAVAPVGSYLVASRALILANSAAGPATRATVWAFTLRL